MAVSSVAMLSLKRNQSLRQQYRFNIFIHEPTMSSTTSQSSKPLKRLSLLQSPTSTTFAFDASRAAADALPSPASPQARPSNVSKNTSIGTRRQSSIFYVPADNVDGSLKDGSSPRTQLKFSESSLQNAPVLAIANVPDRGKRQSASLAEEPSPALTLAEKYVALFIACAGRFTDLIHLPDMRTSCASSRRRRDGAQSCARSL